MTKRDSRRETERERTMKERCGVIRIHVFVYLCACKFSD